MKTIRTIIATLSVVLLTFALAAWFSVRRNAAFIQRTIYQGFDQTFVVALVMGCAFLLIAIILTVAIVSTDDDDDEEDEEEESFRPRHATRPPASRGEQPYRRVSRSVEQSRARREEDEAFVRPVARAEAKPVRRKAEEAPAPQRRERTSQRSEDIPMSRREAAVKREKKAPRPEPVYEEEDEEELEPIEMAPTPRTKPHFEAKRIASEPKPEVPKTEPEPKAKPEPEPLPEKASQAAAEPAEVPDVQEETAVRCVFCGAVFSRDSQVCPVCGKKR